MKTLDLGATIKDLNARVESLEARAIAAEMLALSVIQASPDRALILQRIEDDVALAAPMTDPRQQAARSRLQDLVELLRKDE